MANFDDALIALIIGIVQRYYMLWGKFPSVDEVRAGMQRQ